METPNLPNLPTNVARLPIPGNAEWALWFAVEIVFAIIWAASDAVDANTFVLATTVTTFAYLISRGIAKASRVLEH
jgi:nicotinamide riboside transporter PnuC